MTALRLCMSQLRSFCTKVTMLSVMDKYGPMEKLEHLSVCNLSMGSVLILLPFSPYLKTLSMKYQLGDGDTAPNLTDELFLKIFKKNKFEVSEDSSTRNLLTVSTLSRSTWSSCSSGARP